MVEELAGPLGGDVLPELLELFLEQISADSLEVVAQQFAQAQRLGVGQILRPLQQASARLGQDRFVAIGLQAFGFVSANLWIVRWAR